MDISIKEAIEELNIGRTKLYALFKQLDIKPQKKGNKSFLSLQQVSSIKDFISESEQYEQTEQKKTTEKDTTENTTQQEIIKKLETELEKEREENKALIREVGLWQGRAKTLEEQNQKLLELSPPEKEREPIEEAEIIEEGKPKKKRGWFSFFRS